MLYALHTRRINVSSITIFYVKHSDLHVSIAKTNQLMLFTAKSISDIQTQFTGKRSDFLSVKPGGRYGTKNIKHTKIIYGQNAELFKY